MYFRILGWFLLNLLLLAVALAVFAQAWFGINPASLVSGRAGEQIGSMGRLLVAELRGQPPDQWSAILRRYEQAYDVSLFLFGPRGEWLAGTPDDVPGIVRAEMARLRPPRPAPPGEVQPPPRLRDGPAVSLLQTPGPLRYWALLSVHLPGAGRPLPGVLVIGSRTLDAGGLFFDFRPWLAFAAGAVLLSALFWLPLVRGMTGAIRRIAAGTARFAEGRFDEPVDVRSRDELGALARSVNEMAARLDDHLRGQRRFLGDIAHELCAPLARIQVALGIIEQRTAPGAVALPTDRERLADLREEVDHMAGLVNELLSFSRASLGGLNAELQTVDLLALVRRVVGREAAGARIVPAIDAELRALADPHLLERALGNILRNAVRYAGNGGPIEVTAERASAEEVRLRVRDHGSGVPPATLARLFDPFFRVDAARARETGGVGLGLAIVKTCIEACGGAVSARNHPEGGLEIELRLAGGA